MPSFPSTVVNQPLKSRDLYFNGDSLTALGSSDWPANIGKLYPGSALQNSGVGGIDSTTVLANLTADMTAHPSWKRRMVFLWPFVHDYAESNQPATCLANLAAMVAQCIPGWYTILEPLPESTPTQYTGQPLRLIRDSITASVQALYPTQFVPLLSALQAGGNGGTQDNADIANGVVPTSLRQTSDIIHMTLISVAGLIGGNGIVYSQVAANLVGRGF